MKVTDSTASLQTLALVTRSRRRLGAGHVVVIAASIAWTVLILAGPLIAPMSPIDIVGPPRQAPDLAHLFGTDQLGRDVLSRVLHAGRLTMMMALLATVIATVVGVTLGIVAGYVAGPAGSVIMRAIDAFLAIPGLVLALMIIAIMGPGIAPTVIAVGIIFIPTYVRIIYSATQRIRSEEYIMAAVVVGCSPARIMFRHVLPVIFAEVLVLVSSGIGWATLVATALNFLGLGVAPPTAEWGADLGQGTKLVSSAWWISAAPGLAITISILLSNFLGNTIARVANAPRIETAEAAAPIAQGVKA